MRREIKGGSGLAVNTIPRAKIASEGRGRSVPMSTDSSDRVRFISISTASHGFNCYSPPSGIGTCPREAGIFAVLPILAGVVPALTVVVLCVSDL